MRRLIYQTHSWLGIVAAAGLLLVGLTGSALVFKKEIDDLLAPEVVRMADPAAPRMEADAFLSALQTNLPGERIVGWGIAAEQGMNDQVYAVPLGRTEGRMIYVDPSTARPAGGGEQGKTFSDWLLEMHYTFLVGHAGELIAGLFGVVLCLLGITGVVIYRNFWKTLFQLRWKKSARILFSDTHKMVGIGTTLFNLLLGFTGAWWNLSHLIGHLFEEMPEPVVRTVERGWAEGISISGLVREADEALPGYQANWISLPMEKDGDIMMFGGIREQGVLRSPYGSVVVFNGADGSLKSAAAAGDGGIWAQVVDSFRPLHFGNFGGLPVQVLWCLGGLSPAILSVTGCLMWWKRKRR